ncbi:MAG: DUF86 domain-containing protein [Planctomycetes bacterium]|nr:DUF86 domain-containing protein [Planctomycetota bacterium]
MTADEADARLALLRDNLEKLDRIPQASYEEFAQDFRNLDSALHRIQTTIQALIDLGSMVIARRGLAAPATSRDILERLEAAGVLPAGSTTRFGPMFAFRNRVVHLYDRIDPRIVYRLLHEERSELRALLDLLLAGFDGDPADPA